MSLSTGAQAGRAATRADGERSRERILDAAERLFAEGGYAGTGIAAISRVSGLPASSIYWFFQSKQDLAAGVIDRAAERWLDGMTSDRDEIQPFRSLLERGLERMGGELPLFMRLEIQLAFELGERDPEIMKRLRGTRGRGRGMVRDALEGVFSRISPDRAPALADDLASLAMAFAEGAVIARHLDPERIDLERISEDLEVALLAVARHRAAAMTS